MTLQKHYIRQIRAAMSKLPYFEEKDKEAMVQSFTGNRTTHISEMTTYEAIALLRSVNGRSDSIDPNRKFIPKPGDKMRKQIIAMAREIGWSKDDKADMPRINDWCVQFGLYHKPLNAHNEDELRHLVTQYKKVYKSFLKAV